LIVNHDPAAAAAIAGRWTSSIHTAALIMRYAAHQRADFEKKVTVQTERRYEDVVGALTDVGLGWTVGLLTFVGGTSGLVHKKHMENDDKVLLF
jgi:hypothetical protein